MKNRIISTFENSFGKKLLQRGKLITITSSTQIGVQCIGFISSILVIRLLSTQQYAFYTLANTILGVMVIIADGGIASSVMYQGAKVWTDKNKFGSVIKTGLDLRKKFSILSLSISVPILYLILIHNGANPFYSVIIILCLIPSFFASLSSTLFEIAPKLHQDIIQLQKIQIRTNLERLSLICIGLFLFPFSYIAILLASIPQVFANKRLKHISAFYTNFKEKPDPEIGKQILKSVKKILPGSIYFCLSGQITIWIVSLLGSTKNIAAVGALGRLAIMLTVINILFTTLVLPRFARMRENRGNLLKRYLQIQGILLLISTTAILFFSIFKSNLLWIIGTRYKEYSYELILTVISSCLGLIAGLSFSLSVSRNWILNPIILISVNIGTIITGVSLINISSIQGALKLNILVMSAEVLMYFTYCLYKILKIPMVHG